MDDMTVVITQNLELDMVRVLYELLDVNPGVAERLIRFHAGSVVTLDQADVVMGDAHAATATAGDRLDHDRVANPLGNRQRFGFVFHQPIGTGGDGNAGFFGQITADGLIFQCVHRPGAGADEPDIAAFANVREVSVLGEEAVARVDGIHISDFCRANEAIYA